MPVDLTDKLRKGWAGAGGIADAGDIETTDASNVQTRLNNIFQALLGWNFDASTIDGSNPGATNLALNSAQKDDATIVSFNTTSAIDSARFDEFLGNLKAGDRLFLQERTATNTSILYRVTGAATTDGTKVNVPVARERDQGDEFTDDAFLNVSFFSSSVTAIQALFLAEITQTGGVFGFTSNVLIDRDNIEPNYRAVIENTGGQTDVSSLISKVNALYPLTPDVAILLDWASIFDPAHATENVAIVDGYSSLADFRATDDRYESAGVTYTAGAGVSDYSGLSDDLHRVFGLSVDAPATQADDITLTGTSGTANINVEGVNYLVTFNTNLTTTASDFVSTHGTALTAAGVTVTSNAAVLTFTSDTAGTTFTIAAPANVSGDLGGTLDSGAISETLLSITDGATQIPFIDMTTSGNFRVNNFTPARTNSQVVTNHFVFASLDASSVGQGTISQGGVASTYLLPDYPADTTSQSRTLQLEFEVLASGSDTGAAGFINVDIPDADAASTTDQQHTFQLGPLHGNRSVTATFRMVTRVSGNDLLLDITLQSVDASDITFGVDQVVVVQNYTTTTVIDRVDDFRILQDAAGDFTFAGPSEILLSFQPVPNTDRTNVVPVVRDNTTGSVDELNDVNIADPVPGFDAIQVPDTIDFRTFLPDHFLVHSELASIVGRRDTKWAYGFARLNTVTDRATTEAIDLAAGTTLGGAAIATSSGLVVYSATGTGTGSGQLVGVVGLPVNYTDFQFVHITERDPGPPVEWRHTIIATALLASGHVAPTDLIRLQGNTDLTWNQSTRGIATADASQEIYRVVLTN